MSAVYAAYLVSLPLMTGAERMVSRAAFDISHCVIGREALARLFALLAKD